MCMFRNPGNYKRNQKKGSYNLYEVKWKAKDLE